MHFLWVIIIGFVAGIIARLLAPGPNNPAGFILTTVLGIVGAFLATFIGQAVGWYRLGLTLGALAQSLWKPAWWEPEAIVGGELLVATTPGAATSGGTVATAATGPKTIAEALLSEALVDGGVR